MLVLIYLTEIGLRNCAAICFLLFCLASSIIQVAAQPTSFRSYNPNARKGMTQRFLEDADKITVLIEKDGRNVALYKQRAEFYKNLLELNFDNKDETIYADKFEADLLHIIDLEKTAFNYSWGGSWFSYRLMKSPPPEKIGELYPSNQYLDKAVSNFLNSIRLDPKPENLSGTYGQLSELYRIRPQKLLSSPNFHQWRSKIPLELVLNDLDNSITYRRKSFEIGAEFPAADQLKALLSETYRNNAEIAFKLGEYKTALKFYEDGQKFLSSEYSQCYYYAGWGNVYLKLNNLDKAIEIFRDVPKTADPKCIELFTNRGTAFALKGDFKRALSEYGTGLTLDSSDSLYGNGRAYIERAKLYLKTGRTEDALKDLNLALEKKYIAVCPQVYKIRAEACRKLGKPQLAASDQQTADSLKNQPNCPID